MFSLDMFFLFSFNYFLQKGLKVLLRYIINNLYNTIYTKVYIFNIKKEFNFGSDLTFFSSIRHANQFYIVNRFNLLRIKIYTMNRFK